MVLLTYWWECDGRHLCACDVAGAGDVAWQSVPRLAHASNECRAATDRARATRRNHQHSTGQRRHLLLRYDRRRLLLLIVLHRGLLSPHGVTSVYLHDYCIEVKGKGSPYSITKRRVPDLIPVLGSQPASDVSHKPGGRLPLLSDRPAVACATLNRAATISLLGEQRHNGCEQFA